jgi:hypothetical protein
MVKGIRLEENSFTNKGSRNFMAGQFQSEAGRRVGEITGTMLGFN